MQNTDSNQEEIVWLYAAVQVTGWSTNRLFRTHPPDLLYMRASQTPNTKTCWQGYCANIKASSNLFSLLGDTYTELDIYDI